MVRPVQIAAAIGATLLLAVAVVWFYRYGMSEPEEMVQGEAKDEMPADSPLTVTDSGRLEINRLTGVDPGGTVSWDWRDAETDNQGPEGFELSAITPALEERMRLGGMLKDITPVNADQLVYLSLRHVDFEGHECEGELVVHRQWGQEVLDAFIELYEAGFPMNSVKLMDLFDGNDDLSKKSNNTSAFCTRPVEGQSMGFSKHSYGIAIDINPIQNPYIKDGKILPTDGMIYLDRDDVRPGMIVPGSPVYEAFLSRGWSWGGHWRSLKDYMHIEKKLHHGVD